MHARLSLVPSLVARERDGALFVRYTPTLEPLTCARGSLTFATYDCEVSAPQEEHESAKAAARANAAETLRLMAEGIK